MLSTRLNLQYLTFFFSAIFLRLVYIFFFSFFFLLFTAFVVVCGLRGSRNNEWKMIEGILKKYGALGVGLPAGWSPPAAAGGPTGFGQVRVWDKRESICRYFLGF